MKTFFFALESNLIVMFIWERTELMIDATTALIKITRVAHDKLNPLNLISYLYMTHQFVVTIF
jgi:hypothetical protein